MKRPSIHQASVIIYDSIFCRMLDPRIRRLITNIVYKKKTHYVLMQTLRWRKKKKEKKEKKKEKKKKKKKEEGKIKKRGDSGVFKDILMQKIMMCLTDF